MGVNVLNIIGSEKNYEEEEEKEEDDWSDSMENLKESKEKGEEEKLAWGSHMAWIPLPICCCFSLWNATLMNSQKQNLYPSLYST